MTRPKVWCRVRRDERKRAITKDAFEERIIVTNYRRAQPRQHLRNSLATARQPSAVLTNARSRRQSSTNSVKLIA
jgi:hypothetical protein